MARAYGNLGLIYEECGELDKARELGSKAHELYDKIGMKPDAARLQKFLNVLEE